jgi:hypothetical protein
LEQSTLQFKKLRNAQKHFDRVAIIRGGGGDTGLSTFNHDKLAQSVATFPLPVFTEIGHATHLTITKMVDPRNNFQRTNRYTAEKLRISQRPHQHFRGTNQQNTRHRKLEQNSPVSTA